MRKVSSHHDYFSNRVFLGMAQTRADQSRRGAVRLRVAVSQSIESR
jgi:hypothetical protein